MNISEVSGRLADSISKELGYSEDKQEIIAYGIETTILSIVGLSAILLIALPLKVLFPTVIAVIFGGGLRKLSGGAHFNTPLKCLAFGAVIYPLIGLTAKGIFKYDLYRADIQLLALIIAVVIILFIAPVDSEAKPIHSPTFKKKLKIASVSFVLIALLIIMFSNNTLLNTSVVLGIVYQTITLLPVFNKKEKEVSI